VTVEVHIERLVLHGVEPRAGTAAAIGRAVEAELARLSESPGLPRSALGDGALPRLDAGRVDLPPSAGPQAIGRAIAAAVHRGLTR
jgi:hypothetical protein